MFTQDQLKQLQQLFDTNNQIMKKIIREEVEVEVKKVSDNVHLQIMNLSYEIDDIKDTQKDFTISMKRLEKGQEELRIGQEGLTVVVNGHTKILAYIKKKLNKVAKDVNVIGRSYNEEIVGNRNRIKRLEDVVGVGTAKH